MDASYSVYIEWEAGTWRCYVTPDGRVRQQVGCKHKTTREASQHAELVEARMRKERQDVAS